MGDPAAVVLAWSGGKDCGHRFDGSLLADLPGGVDPCGEGGEFHTLVHGGPIFDAPVAVLGGAVERRGSFVFCDLLPDARGAPAAPSA